MDGKGLEGITSANGMVWGFYMLTMLIVTEKLII